MQIVVWEPWVFHMCDMSQVSHKKVEKRGGGDFLPNFQESLFVSIDSYYYMDLSCCRSITKSFVM